MVIILCLYIVALWLVFSKFKLVRWGWLSGTVSVASRLPGADSAFWAAAEKAIAWGGRFDRSGNYDAPGVGNVKFKMIPWGIDQTLQTGRPFKLGRDGVIAQLVRNDDTRRRQLFDQIRAYRETLFSRHQQQTVLKPLIDQMLALLAGFGVPNVVAEIDSTLPMTGRPTGWSPNIADRNTSPNVSSGSSSRIAISSSTTSRSISTSSIAQRPRNTTSATRSTANSRSLSSTWA